MDSRKLLERSQALVSQCWVRTHLVQQQLAIAADLLAESKKLLARAVSVTDPPCRGAGVPTAEPFEPQAAADGARHTFTAVTELIARIEDATSRDADLTGRLIEDIILAIQVVADPSLLMGILLEGMAETVLERLSADERRETAIALCTLLWDRINQGVEE